MMTTLICNAIVKMFLIACVTYLAWKFNNWWVMWFYLAACFIGTSYTETGRVKENQQKQEQNK